MEGANLPERVTEEGAWVVDTHFHLDRLTRELGLSITASFGDIIRGVGQVPASQLVGIKGAVTSFCDPQFFPSLMRVEDLMSREMYKTVGVHPKSVNLLTRHERELKFQLWDSRRLVVYGELGLDRTTHPYEWVAQEFLHELLRWVPPEGVLVLHARGVPRDRLNMEPTLRLLSLCQAAGIPNTQYI
ncbi:uncharacterized protein LOC123562111 [Mercenaria mercenaria]|uniref:uncharacterized protein LOC123562111 n=1 Tax=Mercenaria mercenaria TaxID=6596 RepID=UPI00234F98DE|nr:uncharacterized protein LOC123562111 [Mercenaria mercenaria]